MRSSTKRMYGRLRQFWRECEGTDHRKERKMISTKGSGRLGLSAELGRGHTFPASSPLFPDFPVTCRNVESISVLFETDSDAALELIPAVLDIPKPATAALNILDIPTSGMGEFYEASFILHVLYKG